VPAQVNAKNYLEEAAQFFEGDFFAGGHSKGGNLAVYAAMFADKDAQSRIKGVYNMDGPGFNEQVMALENYAKVAGRVHTYLPQSSVVGMLLEHSEDFSVVQSDAASLAQHDIYSWQVEPSGFVLAQGLTNASLFIDSAMKNWVAAMQPTQREKLIDGIYEILSSTDVRTLRELLSGKSTFTILRHVSKMDAQKRQVILDALRMLAKSLKKTLPEFLGMISGG